MIIAQMFRFVKDLGVRFREGRTGCVEGGRGRGTGAGAVQWLPVALDRLDEYPFRWKWH
jgi:hypothetical protein